MRVGVGTNFNVSNLSIVRGIAYCYEDFSCSLEPTIPLPLFDPDNFDDLEAFAEKIYEDSLRDHIIFHRMDYFFAGIVHPTMVDRETQLH